ncbi:RecX family transcriptional regulator (plasmid) [Aneurinibacillus sp. Ricciae_BoGa-3]|uniref:RecX family transcriptional regulator n=1 Tax=Aneurinibacillus sp. Ricciae_BoGa-3 TaxID=3022697 RepID=UPI00233FD4CD|nr:RecX family transcriptional regulator [Aneurinibacillus sp. Ricciae_BoGa-3]WCK57059.1 RecX family transcriptional regulator [Aneurinibacillus sp. Ricciae_BoGa-3]
MKKITKIEQQKRHKNRYNIYLDDTFAFGVDEDVLIKFSLSTGKGLEDAFIEDVLMGEEITKAFNYAVNLLSFRSRSKGELNTKMKQKGYEPNIMDKAIEKLVYYGYLNDYDFSKQLVHDRQKFKKAGKNLLKQELYHKGVDKEVIEQVLQESVNEEEEYQQAYELTEKKAKSLSNDDRNAKYRKLTGLLARKGYSFDIISKVIKEVL